MKGLKKIIIDYLIIFSCVFSMMATIGLSNTKCQEPHIYAETLSSKNNVEIRNERAQATKEEISTHASLSQEAAEAKILKAMASQQKESKEIRLGCSKDEVDILERITAAEAGGEPHEGQIAVVNVILNRVNSEFYPDDIKSVVFQKSQFSPISNGQYYKIEVTEEVKNAVKKALDGEKVVDDEVLFFLNEGIATDLTIPKSKTFAKKIGDHSFYK